MVTTTRQLRALTPDQLEQFETNGHLILKGFYRPDEVKLLNDTFMEIHRNGPFPGHFTPKTAEEAKGDPLKMYPRIMHPHRFNDVARQYLLDARLEPVLADLFGEEPLAAQSMLYFKPAGGRGQALHQDNFYLNVDPGTCIAAWLALDYVDPENGCLEVVPGTHAMDLFCPEEADPANRSPASTCHRRRVWRRCRCSWSRATCSSSTARSSMAPGPTPARTASAARTSATTSAARRSGCPSGTGRS